MARLNILLNFLSLVWPTGYIRWKNETRFCLIAFVPFSPFILYQQVKTMRTKTSHMVRENEELLQKLEKLANISGGVDPDQHLMMVENASLVQAENDLLKEKVVNLRRQQQYNEDNFRSKFRELKSQVGFNIGHFKLYSLTSNYSWLPQVINWTGF